VSDASAWRLLQALAWLRWRLLINAITRSGARDLMERLSRAAESVLPIAILVVMAPAAMVLAGIGTWCGAALAAGEPTAGTLAQVVRWTLAAVLLMTLTSPLIFSAGHQGSATIRLLLLPFPQHVLYLSHSLGALADPWIVLTVPMLLGIVIGHIAGGAAGPALFVAAASVFMVIVLLGIAALVSALLQLIARNRRRAEMLVLGGTLLIIVVSLIPSAFIEDAERGRARARIENTEKGERGLELPGWAMAATQVIPSEAYTTAIRDVTAADRGRAVGSFSILVAWSLLTHGLTWPLYQRMLRTPSTTGSTRHGSAERAFGTRIPGIGPVVSAVAIAFARLAFRTPRGRTLVLAPIVMVLVFTLLTSLRGVVIPIGPASIGGGFPLAIFGFAIAIMSLGPFLFNQFAVDRAGLTLEFLAPLALRELLYGKALGGVLIVGAPVAASIAAGVFTGALSPPLWGALITGSLAVYTVFAPLSAILSLLFPRTVDLASIGQASNAHQAAGLLGTLSLGAIAAPPSLLAAVGLRMWQSPAAALALVFGWLLVSIGIAFLLFRIAERLLEDRRENLLMVAVGR
jgi:hypothetical protein